MMRSGFTLVEIMMAILLLSILATIGITQFTDFSKDARTVVTTEKLMALKTAIMGDPQFQAGGEFTKQGYQSHCTAPPAALVDLITMPVAGICTTVYNPFLKSGWRGPYVSTTDALWNVDAWGTTLEYYVTGPPARTIRSCGPDKTCGTTDDITVTY